MLNVARWSFEAGVEWLHKSDRYGNEPCHYHWQDICHAAPATIFKRGQPCIRGNQTK